MKRILNRLSNALVFALLITTLYGTDAIANDNSDHHPIVAGFERFLEVDEVSDVERGMLLLNELNCSSCHGVELQWPVAAKKAPILTNVGDRIQPSYFKEFLLDPHATKPGTTMPNVLVSKSPAEREEIAEALAHFLASTGTATKQNASAKFVSEGETLFHSIGCVACHNPQNESVEIATSIPLGDIDRKYTLPSLTNFLQNPLHTRPSGRMPKLNLSGDEAQKIASYLLRDTVVDAKINFAYYEGSWEKLPNFDQLKPVKSGITSGFDVKAGPKKDRFGIVFTGFWETAAKSEYRFRLGSDDGSKLLINGKTVVDNDGVHGNVFKEGKVTLEPGIHQVRVEFFEFTGGEELAVQVFGGGLQGVGLESVLRSEREVEETEESKPFVLDLVKAAAGKKHFVAEGCANCHDMKLKEGAIAPNQKAASLSSQLQLDSKCLSSKPAGNAPFFGFNESQIKSIQAAIRQLGKTANQENPDEQKVHEKLVTFNCYTCHERERADKLVMGGVIDPFGESFEVFGRKKWFTGTQKEMGDEGQHPPSLKLVGSKLNPAWMDKVLTESIKSRPYMLTRMPAFGKTNLGEIASELRKVDALSNVVKVEQTEKLSRVKKHGRFLAGEDGLSCIKCHTFGKYAATGVQALDLTTMTQRLDKDWFMQYMQKPGRFRRGTRMPESWPGGQTFFKDLLDGDDEKQIDAVWQYLADGDKAIKPKGLVRAKNELKAVTIPRIYRNFIEGAGARAIGIGYPEQVNLAFDAENCRTALIWQQNFMDASRHWTGRGQGFEPPLGDNVLKLSDKIGFFLVENPDLRPQFKGYRFDKDRRPIFLYRIGDVEIEDQPIPYVDEDENPFLKRKFVFKSDGAQQIGYRIVADEAVQVSSEGDELRVVTDRWSAGIKASTKLEVDPDTSKKSVTARIQITDGSAELIQTYAW